MKIYKSNLQSLIEEVEPAVYLCNSRATTNGNGIPTHVYTRCCLQTRAPRADQCREDN